MTVHLRQKCFVETNSGSTNRQQQRVALFSRLLGCWYDVFPFKLSDLTSGIHVKPLSERRKKDILSNGNTGLVPNALTEEERKELLNDVEDDAVVKAYNEEVDEVSKTMSFKASVRSEDCGVVADSDVTFSGTLKRIASACLVDDVCEKAIDYRLPLGLTGAASKLGIVSTHRSMRPTGSLSIHGYEMKKTFGFTSYLDQKEYGLVENLQSSLRKMKNRCETMNGLLQQLENLGHAPADHVEGLNVELFDFQRQAVGWALDRERGEGGLERFLWTKLPDESRIVLLEKKRTDPIQLYYSPVLDMFRMGAPSDVRGGLIAAQMGLGKTVISLSLVLLNPAPALPLSGTEVGTSSIPASGPSLPTHAASRTSSGASSTDATDEVSWPPAPALPAGAPKKRGSIFSRGTLVVCNVSLVGQWIDEAKSKLKDPGLVYSYHGQNRKRNALLLAKNAIVVTTYSVLQSDANHHATKSKDPNYCAPCEQVRWWRIICDESHSVRDANTKNFKALVRLPAVNKWCVTGTPMNTTPRDLKTQLSFVGINNVDKMFSVFANSMGVVFNPSGGRRRGRGNYTNAAIGPFLFFMRNVMIRHALTQTGSDSHTGIMTLPPKVEKVIEIDFTEAERKEYDKIQEKAIKLYEQVKRRGNVSKQYLRLTSALLPLRLSCSGGQIEEGQVTRKNVAVDDLKGNEFQHDLEEGTECSVCLYPIEDPSATKCSPVPHIFCKECIQSVFAGAASKPCPCCRSIIKASEMRDVIPVPDESAKDETKETSEKKPEEEKAPKKKKKNKELKDSDILFRSKFEMLLKELTRIRDEEPGSKSLVFSQFTSTLQWMKQELPKHGFQYKTLSGDMSMEKRAEALRKFKSDPLTTIFLLSMRAGAAGINLTEANRVFLMEPAMNPALEAQAIGRVYRLGQRKPVTVIKMRMKNSFESRLVKVLKRKFDTGSKPDSEDSSSKPASAEEKKTEDTAAPGSDTAAQSSANQTTTEVVTADVGHMRSDKANLMTEEFDALFGITEPEDLPDKPDESEKTNGYTSSSSSKSDQSTSSNPYASRSFRASSCNCGTCGGDGSDEDEDDNDREEGCIIS